MVNWVGTVQPGDLGRGVVVASGEALRAKEGTDGVLKRLLKWDILDCSSGACKGCPSKYMHRHSLRRPMGSEVKVN